MEAGNPISLANVSDWMENLQVQGTFNTCKQQFGATVILRIEAKHVPVTNNGQQVQGSTGNQNNNGAIGKEIVPVDGNDQQGKRSAREEVISDVVAATQQIQITNMFAALEGNDGDNEDNNQLVVVEDNSTTIPATNSPIVKELNPTAAVFTPKSTGVLSTSRRGKENNPNEKNNTIVEGNKKESTAAWVRTFNEKIVATNQSCQEIPSQATEIDAIFKVDNVNGNLQLDGRKVWSQQVEEDQEEGELPEGASGEEESSDEENDQEQQSVNNKGKGQQSVEKFKINKEHSGQGDRIQTDAEGEGGQVLISPNINQELPPAKPNILYEQHKGGTDGVVELVDGQVKKVDGTENTNIGVSDSIQSCDNAGAGSDSALAIPKEHVGLEEIKGEGKLVQAKQKSQRKQKINQEEEEKTSTLKTFNKIHWHSQGELSSNSTFLTGTPTCSTRKAQQGRLWSNTSTLQDWMSISRYGSQDSARILSGTNQSQPAVAGNHDGTIREVLRMMDNSRVRTSFRGENLDRDERNDRGLKDVVGRIDSAAHPGIVKDAMTKAGDLKAAQLTVNACNIDKGPPKPSRDVPASVALARISNVVNPIVEAYDKLASAAQILSAGTGPKNDVNCGEATVQTVQVTKDIEKVDIIQQGKAASELHKGTIDMEAGHQSNAAKNGVTGSEGLKLEVQPVKDNVIEEQGTQFEGGNHSGIQNNVVGKIVADVSQVGAKQVVTQNNENRDVIHHSDAVASKIDEGPYPPSCDIPAKRALATISNVVNPIVEAYDKLASAVKIMSTDYGPKNEVRGDVVEKGNGLAALSGGCSKGEHTGIASQAVYRDGNNAQLHIKGVGDRVHALKWISSGHSWTLSLHTGSQAMTTPQKQNLMQEKILETTGICRIIHYKDDNGGKLLYDDRTLKGQNEGNFTKTSPTSYRPCKKYRRGEMILLYQWVTSATVRTRATLNTIQWCRAMKAQLKANFGI
ncbi:hypothetical protein A4A49_04518 [Nicotiana attenuata]|uniref:Uncharacterized protein n=1 Tax=Nicotiana attenuata TaxID=49451 RepID=A0A1J6HRP4_NICAT|nr:hypothetical protein A4A49_04518 [Nicotiana attenuata]